MKRHTLVVSLRSNYTTGDGRNQVFCGFTPRHHPNTTQDRTKRVLLASWCRFLLIAVSLYSVLLCSRTAWTESGIVTISRPKAPANLSASAISSNQITLRWTDNSNNEKGFKIERSLTGNSFSQIATTGANATTFTVSNLNGSTKYYFRVRAYNSAGNSMYSNTASGLTWAAAPSAPSNLAAQTASAAQINLSWADNSSNETGFKVEQSLDGVNYSEAGTTAAGTTTYNATGLQAATKYYYRVRSYNSAGNSNYSNTASNTTAASLPSAPSGLDAQAVSATQINLNWTDNSSNETGFKVEQSNDGTTFTQVATTGSGVTTYNCSNLQPATAYHYRVRAYNSAGNSAYSPTANAMTNDVAPAAPSALAAAANGMDRIDLTWTDASNNEDGFRVERSMDGSSFSQIGTVAANQSSYSSLNLAANTTYYYRVRSYNETGTSAYCNQASARTNAAAPPKAFPGAVGFGVDTPGGRGGAILKVTNLNDSGPGSLRAAVEASGPRTVVFEVAGTIWLQKQISVRNPYLTIAGQTAPSPGITLAKGELNVNTHNVLVQHIRVRPGDILPAGTDPGGVDGISADGTASHHVVFDHVSVSWSMDENGSSWYDNVHDITFSNSIFSEALDDSIHPKGPHSMGLLVTPNGRNVAIIGNLMAHNVDRNPLMSNGSSTVVANNVMYNWRGGKATNIGNTTSAITVRYATLVSIVGNVYKGGLDTPSSSHAISTSTTLNAGAKVYHDDNVIHNISGGIFRNVLSYNPIVSQPPIWIDGFQPKASDQVASWVIANAGARPADRDAVDERIVNDFIHRTGRIINSQSQVGGFPSLPVSYRTINIPANANGDDDNDGYTNFEESVLIPMAAEVEGR